MKTYSRSLLIFKLLVLMLTLPLASYSQSSMAGGGGKSGAYFDPRGKAMAKEASRWSLQEWMEQKSKIRLMDMWLTMHSPSPYEFSLEGSSNSYSLSDSLNPSQSSKFNDYEGRLQAYAQNVGINIEHENNTEEQFNILSGLLNFRLLGNSIQNTHLTFSWGLRNEELTHASIKGRLSQQFGQVSTQIHITRYFGLNGHYRIYQDFHDANWGDISSLDQEAGLFIDFSAIRIFGSWFKRENTFKTTTTEQKETREGVRTGLAFYF